MAREVPERRAEQFNTSGAETSRAEAKSKAAAARAAGLEQALAEVEVERAYLRHELENVLRSTFCKITAPVRKAASALPPGLRRQARRGARVVYWVMTPHRTRERIAYFRERRRALRRSAAAIADPLPAEKPAAAEPSVLIPLFDAEWYVERYGDIAGTGLTPFAHFLIHGTPNLRDPNPAFDTGWYFEVYRDVARDCVALEHFVHRGAAEGRRPFRDFDFDFYREQAGIADAGNLEAYSHYLTDGREKGIPTCRLSAPVRRRSGANPDDSAPVAGSGAADAAIYCLKAPSFGREMALFVAYSPGTELKPHVLHYVQSLRAAGISVILIVNSEQPLQVNASELLSCVDGLFIRQNKGFDFGAWAHILRIHPEVLNARILYLVNDSLIGPIDRADFTTLLRRIRDNDNADVIGLTENLEYRWHLQSYFLAFKEPALQSAAFEEFFGSVSCLENKQEVIHQYELRIANVLRAAGLNCEPMFRAWDAYNITTAHWKRLLEAGFPFIKTEVIIDANASGDSRRCLEVLSARGFDLRLAAWAVPDRHADGCRRPNKQCL